jgi:hypothetical protein
MGTIELLEKEREILDNEVMTKEEENKLEGVSMLLNLINKKTEGVHFDSKDEYIFKLMKKYNIEHKIVKKMGFDVIVLDEKIKAVVKKDVELSSTMKSLYETQEKKGYVELSKSHVFNNIYDYVIVNGFEMIHVDVIDYYIETCDICNNEYKDKLPKVGDFRHKNGNIMTYEEIQENIVKICDKCISESPV